MSLVQVVVKNGMVAGEHNLSTNLAGLYDDSHDYFEVDTDVVKLFGFDSMAMSGGGAATNLEPLTDPRLRAPLDYAKQLQIGLIKRWCGDYITNRYPTYKQLNLMVEQGDALVEMRNFIDAVRAASNAAEEIVNMLNTNEEVLYYDFKSQVEAAVDTPLMKPK